MKPFVTPHTIVRRDGITVRFAGIRAADLLPFLNKKETLFYCEKCINYGKQ